MEYGTGKGPVLEVAYKMHCIYPSIYPNENEIPSVDPIEFITRLEIKRSNHLTQYFRQGASLLPIQRIYPCWGFYVGGISLVHCKSLLQYVWPEAKEENTSRVYSKSTETKVCQ